MNTQVYIFSTSICSGKEVQLIENELNRVVGNGNWNFALDDCDKILRVISGNEKARQAMRILHEKGFECAELD